MGSTGCSLCHVWLQPLPRMVAASATYGCSLCHVWLQARLNAEKNKNDPPGNMDEGLTLNPQP